MSQTSLSNLRPAAVRLPERGDDVTKRRR